MTEEQAPLEEQIVQLGHMAEGLRVRLQGEDGPPSRGSLQIMHELSTRLRALQEDTHAAESEQRNLRAMVDIGQVINSSLELHKVLNEVVDTIIHLTGAERCFLMLRDEMGKLEILAARNWERVSLDRDELEISNTVVQQVVEAGEAVLTTNALTDPRFGEQSSIIAYNLRSILCVPLKVKEELTGVIYTDNRIREGLFSERDRDLLSAFANQAAIALENARLFESVKRTLDEVTELKNLMEDVFASIDNAVITADTRDAITLCNQAAEIILGISREHLMGSPLTDVLSDMSEDLLDYLREVKEQDTRISGLEVHPMLSNRGEVDLSISMTPLKNADRRTEGVALVIDDFTEKRRLEAQRRLFEKMVSPAVIRQLDPEGLRLGGTRREITTLFADIRGYTHFSETADPETLMSVLNKYLAAATTAILAEEGTIDKFLGDAVMAWFNAPIEQEDHAERAVRAAWRIREALHGLHETMPEEMRLFFGIGIHTGEALLGLVGTQQRMEYTAVGDSVNTAKRLQEVAKEDQILISRATMENLHSDIQTGPFQELHLEGKERSIDVCEMRGYPEES